MYVGPGRGSAAGSLVAYCLGITNIDPVPYNLLFERFLNASRISLPDVDVDFCQKSREKVIRYVQFRYGERNTSQISTFGSLQIRAAIKDVSRYLEIPFETANELCKSIPAYDLSLEGVYAILARTQLVQPQPLAKLMEITAKIIGVYRHMSTHAAGIVISNS